MTSKAFTNAMATIAITESQVNVLMAELKGDQLEAVLPALIDTKQACDTAYGAWPGRFDEKGMKRLKRILDKFHGSVTSLDIEEFTSTGLALLESLRARLVSRKADRRRIAAISNLIEKFSKVHEKFDPDLDSLAAYLHAGHLETKWRDIVEAA